MSAACQEALDGVGVGVSASLRAVDCVASEFTSQAFGRLFASGGGLTTALTILLTLFVAIFAIALLLGRTSLSIRSITPRMMTLGLVLTFATSWVAYQSVVWNLAIGTPDYLATMLIGGEGSATQNFGDKIDVVFAAVQQASGENTDISAFSPLGMLWMGAMLFLLGTVGVLVTARIALAVLVALGPIFVVMALFEGTRGMFTGWVKGVTMLAMVPLFAVLGGGVMLELAIPVLSALTALPGEVDPEAAAAFFLIGAVHVALMIMVIKVAGTMVAGWTVFGLARQADDVRGGRFAPAAPSAPPAAAPVVVAPATAAAASTSAAIAAARRIEVSAVPTATPANDAGGVAGMPGSIAGRETKVFATSAGGGQPMPAETGPGRANGIGSRFRAANVRNLEKVK